MRQLWEDAAANYFDPTRFQLFLQNCITTSRTVTFILQSNKHDIAGFDEWYAQYQARWSGDLVMGWAKEARNSIEKRGDLTTCSQVRAQIIAAYMDGPDTDWLPEAMFASPHDIYRTVPRKFFVPHVIENGTLLIERRWVDADLPDTEVLAALAHVYEELAALAVDLLNLSNLSVPTDLASRPKSMHELAMNRAIYLAMKDGSQTGYRIYEKATGLEDRKWRNKVAARYGTAKLKRLGEAKTFRAVAEAFFEMARAILLRDGFHRGMTFFLQGHLVKRVIQTDFPDRASKYVIMRDLARLAIVDGADGVITVGEAWTASASDVPKSGFAAEAKNRGEALMMSAADAKGESFTLQAAFIRKAIRKSKVKYIEATVVDDEQFPLALYQFMKEWNCVDIEKLKKGLSEIDELGIESPRFEQ
jgi:hypothetical protein